MSYLWRLMFVLLNANLGMCNQTVTSTTTRTAVTSTETRTTSQHINGTTDMIPIHPANYVMHLNSTETAVIGSTIVFEAELIPNLTDSEHFPHNSYRFIYQWMNTATKQSITTYDDLKSSISVSLYRKRVAVGDYLVTVAAYLKDDPTEIVAFMTKKFTLTKELNGLLEITQELDYQRHTHTFSTKQPVTLTAKVQDQFMQTDLRYDYFWYRDAQSLANTQQPTYNTSFSDPFNSSLAAVIAIYTSSQLSHLPDELPDSMSSVNNAVIEGSSHERSIDPVNDTLTMRRLKPENTRDYPPFNGIFQLTVSFKDPISVCEITRIDTDPKDRAVNIEKTALINITCDGSAPSSVCMNITDVNSSFPISHACMPILFVYEHQHIVPIKLTSKGWKDVHFFIYNDISRHHMIYSFYGYSSDTLNVPALTVPIVFGVLGILTVMIGGAYILRLRRKANVEVADFDFHPSLTHRQSQGRYISRLADRIRSTLTRDPDRITHSSSLLGKKSSHFKRNPSYEDLYESL